ncbi:hypothetical protein LINGRAHAP2_LOCUS24384 [Linum grandiflorum]
MNIAPFFMPTGSRYIPTEKELVEDYLYNYIHIYFSLKQCYLVQESNLYGGKEPWELLKDHQIISLSEPQKIVYLFTKLKKKSAKSKYFERGIGNGRMHRHGESSEIGMYKFRGRDRLIWTAEERTFKYKNKKSGGGGGDKKWLMYEFRLRNDNSFESEMVSSLGRNHQQVVPLIPTEMNSKTTTLEADEDDP